MYGTAYEGPYLAAAEEEEVDSRRSFLEVVEVLFTFSGP
jgi:hypothetical protein